MSKSISKPQRTGGGGQSQSTQQQRQQPMPNFQQQLRQANSQSVHSVPQNPPVNMHQQQTPPQAQQQIASQMLQQPANIIRPYTGTNPPQNPQNLVSHQQIHVNSNPAQQPNVIPQHVMRGNQFQYQLPNRMSMPTHRPQYTNHHHRNNNAVPTQPIPNMQPQPPNQIYYALYPGQQFNPYMQPHMMQQLNYNPMLLEAYNTMQRYPTAAQPPMNIPNNIQPNEMQINPNASIYQPQQQSQQPKPAESKKREKKVLKVYDENGQEINLSELANDKSTPIPEPSTEKNLNETKTEAAEETAQPSQTPNGIEISKVDDQSDAAQQYEGPPEEESSTLANNNDHVEGTEPNEPQEVSTETTNEASNIQCDNEIIQQTNEPEPSPVKEDESPAVDEITEKIDELALNEPESTDLAEVITAKEETSPLPATDSEVVSATPIISGDNMEVDTGKGVGDSPVDHAKVEDSNASQDATPSSTIKDEEDTDTQSETPQLSRNSSQNGSRVYDKDFLLSLRDRASDNAIANSNQDNMKDIIKRNNNSKAPSHDMFIPSFANQGRSSQNDSFRNKSQAQAVRRPSQPSKNYSDSKSRKITSTSMHQDMYTPAENAWRPGKVTAEDPVEAETEHLLKNVRAILNKLTPQNYHTLLEQFKSFKIDTKDRLTRVIDLIFDKAVKEPSFVVQYAGFCSELIHIKVTETNAKGENVEVKFKNLLILKCERTFFKEMYSDIDNFEERLKEIDECTDEKKKKELEEMLDDDKRLSRRRSIGNIKLIAELYKLNMLNAKIMFACFQNLLKHQHEEYIECLCALITNIGLNLTNAIKSKSSEQMQTFESIFNELKAIHDQKSALKVSSRIRFMILDLLDLRKNNWVPRRKAEGPKTIAQVHEDMDKEARLKALELSDQRKIKSRGGPRDQQDEWQQVNSRKGKGSSMQGQGQGKLSISNLNVLKESLTASSKPAIGTGSPFGMFAHGSHGGTNSNSQSRSSSSTFENKYHVLANDKNPKSNSTFHDSLNAKDRRDERKTSDVTNYYQSNRDNSLPNSRNSSTRSDNFEAQANIEINAEKFQTKLEALVATYGKSPNFNQGIQELLTFCSKDRFHLFITQSILVALDKPTAQRQTWGEFLGQLFVYPVNNDPSEIFEGLKAVFKSSEDFLLDLPKFWEFVAEIIAHALYKVYESKDVRCAEIFKSASRALGEVTGKGYIKLSGSITETLTKYDEATASEILSYLQLNSQTNAKNDIQCPESNQNNELSSTVDAFFERLIKSNCEISSLEKELNTEKLDLKKFFSALALKAIKHYYVNKEKESSTEDSNKSLLNILGHYVKQNEDLQLELLFVSSDLVRELNYPINTLSELFTLFKDEKFATKEIFAKWQTSKRTPSMALAQVERTLKNFQTS